MCSQIICLGVQHLTLTANLEVLCSMDIKKSTLRTDLDSFRIYYTSTESNKYSTATINKNMKGENNGLFYEYIATRSHDINETEKSLEITLNERTDTTVPATFNYQSNYKNHKTDVCSKTSDYNKTYDEGLKILIGNELKELNILNNTIQTMLEEVINATWSFINNHDENVGYKATNLSQKYLRLKQNFFIRTKNISTLINEYNCTPIHLPVEKCEEELRKHQNIILKFEYLRSLIRDYYKIRALQEESHKVTEKYNAFHRLTDLKESINLRKLMKEMTYNIFQNVKLIDNLTQTNNLEIFYVTNFTKDLLDLNYWELQLKNSTNELKQLNSYLQEESLRIPVQEYIQPTMQGIIFVTGFVGNGVLLVIFVRQKDARTAPNMMLLNLAVGDLLNLFINIPLFYSYTMSTKWHFGLHLCKAYRFLRQLGISVSVYSIVAISVQRFIAVTQFNKFRTNKCRISKHLKLLLMILVVWMIGCIIAIPHTVHAGIYVENCYGASPEDDYYPKAITLQDFILLCVIPLAIITLLSLLSAYQLKRSVRELPGEALVTKKLIQSRNVSSNVLIILAIVSAVSYIPLHLLSFVYAWTDITVDQSTYYVAFAFAYTLTFGNSCFNPIALYIVSRKFRCYFNTYLLCRRERKLSENKKQISTGISATTAQTTLQLHCQLVQEKESLSAVQLRSFEAFRNV